MPTMRAVGVARPMAHGQATTKTVTAHTRAWGNTAHPPTTIHTTNVSSDKVATTGTNTRAALSTMRCTGALELSAASTMLMMRAKAVCSPTCRALMRNLPCKGMVPASTREPLRFSTGSGSPVIMLSST